MENDKLVRLSDVLALELKYAENDDIKDGWFGAIDAVMNLPAVDAVEVKHGRWLTKEYLYGDSDSLIGDAWVERSAEYGDCAYCSVCGSYAKLDGSEEYALTNYCPNCGAKMDGEDGDT